LSSIGYRTRILDDNCLDNEDIGNQKNRIQYNNTEGDEEEEGAIHGYCMLSHNGYLWSSKHTGS